VRRYFAALLAIVLLTAGCFGGGSDDDDSNEAGAKDPQTAVRNLLEGIVDGDQARIEGAINPIYADKLAEIGVSDIVELAELTKVEIEDLELSAEFDSERKHARVFVNGKVVTNDGEAELDDKVLLTSIQGERW
jgi:predicted flap endonuclease-1-like 5' DNA nuclease